MEWDGLMGWSCARGLERNGEAVLHTGKPSGASVSDFSEY